MGKQNLLNRLHRLPVAPEIEAAARLGLQTLTTVEPMPGGEPAPVSAEEVATIAYLARQAGAQAAMIDSQPAKPAKMARGPKRKG